MNRTGNFKVLAGKRICGAVLGLAAFTVGVALPGSVCLADDDAVQPPARAARLSSVDGHVQIAQGNEVLADPAVVNAPLLEGTLVTTGDDGRAEIQFEDGSVARISPNSSLVLTVLRGQGSAGEAEIALETGLGYFELQDAGQSGAMRVRFGDNVVTGSGFTVLRINLDNPPGEMAVFSGNAHLASNAAAIDLHGGESVALNPTDPAHSNVAESIEPDSWDSWNSDRDQALTSLAAAKTGATAGLPNGNNPAWSDLDANGNWYNVPGQGYIWSPYDAANAGWDPYGNGNWMAMPGYGYTWISGYPWGYLPYQCGMWNYYDAFGWGWMPGMGGCVPWWGLGFYGGPNVGAGYGGYRPPLRPRLPRHPVRLIAGNNGPHLTAVPMIPVQRRPAGSSTSLPIRDRHNPVTIAGHVVQPLQSLKPRTEYSRPATAFAGQSSGAAGATRIGAPPVRTPAPVAWGSHPVISPAPRTSGGSHSAAASPNSSGGSHASGGSSGGFHSSGGASGGGGGSHSSGGGGGGGGGGHSSGGGGGGGHH